jgi:hypothetical protein
MDQGLAEAMENRWPRMFYMAWLGEGFLLVGRNNEATRLALWALDVAREHKGRGCEALALRVRSEIVLRGDSPDMAEADASYHQAMALAEELGMRPLVAHCHLGLGTLYRRTGDHAKANEHLTKAMTMYREMGMGFWLEKAEAEIRGPA